MANPICGVPSPVFIRLKGQPSHELHGACRGTPVSYKYEILSALPDAAGSAHAAAPRGHSAAVPEWAEMAESQKVCYFMNPKECKFLEEKKRKRKRKHAAMKAALESCGEEIPDRKRYKHSLVPCTQSGGEGSCARRRGRCLEAASKLLALDVE